MGRYFLFLLAVAVGLGLGLLYGWVLSPVEFVDTSPDILRVDYKADYALMVAEAYAQEGDTVSALRRLAQLGVENPASFLAEMIDFAEGVGYTAYDLALMQQLAEALESWNPALDAQSP